ncbi:MAG: 3-isopropylmalate dehydratase small subunit [Candidatus Methanomethylophilus sp.]|jgi:3-isopropylmalate dehydratase small subunit|nr:3-isopropylmalate dehydratase small subunit [Methanomethylophilus sp.]MCI2074402.1 3-isopropylmalate dehydratase small subunit [Methanomethylophilus sp.]MCI2092801.1 3-isopropylmalate dehydratase small subunit [Methanomethylophilus sp.]
MTSKTVEGKVWRFGDNVDTDQIIPAERLVVTNLDHLNDFIFEKVRPGFAEKVGKGDILVAGKNFGCGSSREHAPLSLMEAGFSCIIAESFARIFYRNSMNIGLLLVECKSDAKEGDTVKVSISEGKVTDETSGKEWSFEKYPEFIQKLIDAGGLVNLVKEGKF